MSKKSNDKRSTEELIELLESIPTYPLGQTLVGVEKTFKKHLAEGRDGFARAVASEWILK